MSTTRLGAFAGGFLLMLMLAPLVGVLAGLVVFAILAYEPTHRYLGTLLLMGLSTPLLTGLGVAGVTFRNGDTPRALGWVAGAIVATGLVAGLGWYGLSQLRFGF